MFAIILLVLLLGGTALGYRHLSRRAAAHARTEAEQVARRLRRAMPPAGGHAEQAFVGRREGRVRGWAVGAVVTAVATTVLPLVSGSRYDGSWVLALPVAMAIGGSIGASRSVGEVSGPRAASLLARRADAVVTPVEIWGARLALAPVVLMAVLCLWVLREGAPASAVAVPLGCSTVAVVAWLAVGRLIGRVVAAPMPARSADDLDWQQALRVLAVRDLVALRALVTVVLGTLPGAVALLAALPGAALTVAGLAAAVAGAVLVAGLTDVRMGWMRRHAGPASA